MVDITPQLNRAIWESGITDGICFIFVPHTTAGITINENADPSVKEDILEMLNRLIPGRYNYKHIEGNAPAHIKASLIGSSVSVPIRGGKLQLGTWQGVMFCEFDGPRNRAAWVSFLKTR
jgi:secondary thiamine-phosphate synthase enzyme